MNEADLLFRGAFHVVEAAARGVPLLAFALMLVRAARGWSAAKRHAVLHAALIVQAILLIVPPVLPRLEVSFTPPWAQLDARSVLDASNVVPSPSTARRAEFDVGAIPATTRLAASPPSLPQAIVWLWAALSCVALLELAMSFAHRGVIRRRARHACSSVLSAVFAEAARLGIHREIRVLIGADGAVPVTWGMVRPVLLLPGDFGSWPADRQRAVLLHELAHVTRFDAFSRGLAAWLRVILWFNPLLWMVRRELMEASERACDDAVLIGGIRPSDYVGHLAYVARGAIDRGPVPGLAVVTGGRLETRARAILDRRPSRSRATARHSTIAAVVALPVAFPLALLSAVPAASETSVQACPYLGGRHVDRVTEESGGPVWHVEWEGRACRVVLASAGPIDFNGDLWGIRAMGPSATFALDVRNHAGQRGLDARPGDDGQIELAWTVNGERRAFDVDAQAWFSAFLLELDRHTGFAADQRFPRLLARGGVDAVVKEVERTQGGHAGGAYLRRLVEERSLTAAQLTRVLSVATEVVSVDAEMGALLSALRSRYDASTLLAAGYREAARTMHATAAP